MGNGGHRDINSHIHTSTGDRLGWFSGGARLRLTSRRLLLKEGEGQREGDRGRGTGERDRGRGTEGEGQREGDRGRGTETEGGGQRERDRGRKGRRGTEGGRGRDGGSEEGGEGNSILQHTKLAR